jgi:hypothetical protein
MKLPSQAPGWDGRPEKCENYYYQLSNFEEVLPINTGIGNGPATKEAEDPLKLLDMEPDGSTTH